VSPRAGLEAVAKGKFPYPCLESNPDHAARSIVTILTEIQLTEIRKCTALWWEHVMVCSDKEE